MQAHEVVLNPIFLGTFLNVKNPKLPNKCGGSFPQTSAQFAGCGDKVGGEQGHQLHRNFCLWAGKTILMVVPELMLLPPESPQIFFVSFILHSVCSGIQGRSDVFFGAKEMRSQGPKRNSPKTSNNLTLV